MKINIKKLGFLFGITLISVSAFGQQNIITLSAPESGNQIHAACKQVHLAPGYSYHASTSQSMHSYVDPYLFCDITYIGRPTTNDRAPDDLDQTLEVGTTEGSFSVAPNGAATYDIPLVVPPGTAGMMPHLSLSYNSGTIGDILGVGWSLNGLSAITRTSQTIYHDGKVSPVSLDFNDRFELDGKRLIVTNAGSYGANGTKYGTEEESFEEIVSVFILGDGPQQFKVTTKDGTQLFYGYSNDSRIEASGGSSTVLTWLLNYVLDNKGNYMTISYIEDNVTGEYRPDHIDYTGNAGMGLTPYNQIKFVYGNRADKQLFYFAGHQVKQTSLLVAIEMYAEGTKMHEYNFNYTYDIRSHLAELIEKGSDGKQYNSTKFSWENVYDIKPVENPLSYFDNKIGDYLSADVNGDGFSDIIQLDLNNWKLHKNNYLATGSTSFIAPSTSSTGVLDDYVFWVNQPSGTLIKHNAQSCDLNGDGYDDMLVYLPTIYDNPDIVSSAVISASFKYFLSNGTDLVEGASLLTPMVTISTDDEPFTNTAYTVGDFDGDGTSDLFVYYSYDSKWFIYSFKTGVPVLIASGNTANPFGSLHLEGIWEESEYQFTTGFVDSETPLELYPQMADFYAFDMNGDGKDEIVVVGDGKLISGYIYSGKHTFFVNELTQSGTLHEICRDYYPSQHNFKLPYQGNENTIRPGDFNGDGKTDMLVWDVQILSSGSTVGSWHISYSTGTSFLKNGSTVPLSDYIPTSLKYSGYYYHGQGTENKREFFTADFNNDGKSDIVEKITDGSNGTDFHTLYSMGNNSFLEDNTHFANTYSKNAYFFDAISLVGDYDGDGHPDILKRDGDPTRNSAYFSFLPNKFVHKVRQITNGLNFTTYVEYNTLAQLARQNKYTKESSAIFPLNDLQKGIPSVSKTLQSDGIGGLNEIVYTYKGAKLHRQGKGFLGFTATTMTDMSSNFKTECTYNQPTVANFFQLTLFKKRQSLVNGAGVLVADIQDRTLQYQTNSLGGIRYYTYANNVVDNDILHGNSTTSTIHKDIYGNIDVQTSTNGAETSTTTNTFEQKGSFIPSRLTSTITTVNRSGSPSYTRTITYTNDAFGQPITIDNDGGNTLTSVTYNNNTGVVLSTSVSGSDFLTRSIVYEYDSKQRFSIKQTNALGHIQQASYDNAYGNTISTTDPNLLLTQYTYDGFGRLTQTTTPSNQQINSTLSWDNSGLANSLYFIETAETGEATSTVHMDVLGRTLRSQKTGFNGTNINTDVIYDNNGQITSVSEPYYDGGITTFNNFSYDSFFRPQTFNSSSGSSITYSYAGNTTTAFTVTGSGTTTVSKTLDASGLQTSVIDDGGTINYTYHACGKPLTTVVSGSILPVVMAYDALGRQISNSDPDAGSYTYSYNALGEVKTMQDPIGNVHTYAYDAIGRIITNTGSATDGTITYIYDNKTFGMGLLGTVTTTGSFIGDQDYTYDNLSRAVSKTENNIDGTTYTTTFQFDNLNRVINETYPGSSLATNYIYNTYGYLDKIKRVSDNSLIWQCNGMSEREQVVSATAGNGLTTNKLYSNLGFLENIQVDNSLSTSVWKQGFDFDPTNGNLLSRSDNLLAPDYHKEEFQYDNLDRLIQIQLDGTTTLTTSYAASGNILNKSDVGNYNYAAPQPHAVSSISSPASAFPYMNQNVTYTQFKRASVITEDVYEADLFYSSDHLRKKMVLKNSGAIYGTKYYLGNFERIVTPTITRDLHYIFGSDGLCAIYSKNNTSGFITDTMYYVNNDYLGSISLISGPTGNILQEVSYDPWGKRRSPDTWTASTLPINNLFDRGYTGHEHLDQLHLINMNARLYDPIVGRMLNADDYLESPDFTQSFNRYSYVINNPLKYTDPTGNKKNWEGMNEEEEKPDPDPPKAFGHYHIKIDLGKALKNLKEGVSDAIDNIKSSFAKPQSSSTSSLSQQTNSPSRQKSTTNEEGNQNYNAAGQDRGGNVEVWIKEGKLGHAAIKYDNNIYEVVPPKKYGESILKRGIMGLSEVRKRDYGTETGYEDFWHSRKGTVKADYNVSIVHVNDLQATLNYLNSKSGKGWWYMTPPIFPNTCNQFVLKALKAGGTTLKGPNGFPLMMQPSPSKWPMPFDRHESYQANKF